MSLHALASSRGDGLRPEFLRLFEARAALADPDVIELSLDREQAGPNPLGSAATNPREHTLRFPRGHDETYREPRPR
ncbi:hypothetical protein, partial [Mesorhizobium sp. M4B.F.Ca.ET.200.01.1.1]|uniref:hypothetical protein n=1 Tax=Mesorhizobium sp. M4B.F.Ca.ET.200.01.1.1 TaxID=2563952 RepID=UPI001AEE6A8C